MKVTRQKLHVEARAKQPTPEALLASCMQDVREMFYGHSGDAEKDAARDRMWFREQADVRRMAVLRLASWLNGKGVTLPAERYRGVLLAFWRETKSHCEQEFFKYLPGYLSTCLKRYLNLHGEQLYNEAKGLRGAVAGVLGKLPAPTADPVYELAGVAKVLAAQNRTRKRQAKTVAHQGDLAL